MSRLGWLLSASFLLVGCTGQVKSPDEPLQTVMADKPSVQDDLLKPSIDYHRASRLYIELGLAYLKEGQIGRAKTKLMRAQKLSPNLPEVHYAMGFYKETVGELDQAKRHFLDAIAQSPKSGEARNNYGTFLCRQGQYEEAEIQFVKATKDPEYAQVAEALENAGLCIIQTKNIAKATQYFERAVRMDSRRAEALIELAYIKFNEGVFSEALEYHSLYESQAEHTPRSLWLGIKVAEKYNLKDKAASLRLLLKNQFPQSAQAKELFDTNNSQTG